MADSLRSDGKSVKVTVLAVTEKGSPVYADGFHGMALASASSGEEVAIEIAAREHEIVVGAGLSVSKGDILYIHDDGDGTVTIDKTDTSGTKFMKATTDKGSNNEVWGILLPQDTSL